MERATLVPKSNQSKSQRKQYSAVWWPNEPVRLTASCESPYNLKGKSRRLTIFSARLSIGFPHSSGLR
jgi:hypothetical protein